MICKEKYCWDAVSVYSTDWTCLYLKLTKTCLTNSQNLASCPRINIDFQLAVSKSEKILSSFIFSCGSNSGNGSVGKLVRMIVKKYSSFIDTMDFLETTPKQHLNNTQTTPPKKQNINSTPHDNNDEIYEQLHNMVKFSNNNPNNTKRLPQQHLMTTITLHGEIHKQLHIMVKFTNNTPTTS